MLAPDPRRSQFAGKHTHLKRREESLFARHCPLNLKLDDSCGRTRVGDMHAKMLSRGPRIIGQGARTGTLAHPSQTRLTRAKA
jgi:hypothetical protein